MPRDIALGNPAVHPDEDEFNRWPFSRALADRIAGLGNVEGAPVIGLYGKWGYGKSSVLNFVKYRLEQEHSGEVLLFEFNPWFFTSPEELLGAFFAGLATRLEQSLGSSVKDAGALVKKYSGLFGMIPVVGSGVSKLAEQIGNELSSNSLQNQRERVFDMMRSAERTVVVLIDDLDRLDQAEIMIMLKLVRLTINIPHVVYLLAFDDDLVAQAVASIYGHNNPDAGHQFLEKIIQYPFALPAVGQKRLVDYVLRHARNATDRAGIALTDEDWKAFRDLTDRSLSRRLTTPRQAIRYGSALDFALPMLKDEVNPVQQMVVEGMRVLFPELYVFVRDNSRLFVGFITEEETMAERAQRAMEGAREEYVRAGKEVLWFLFKESRRDQPIAHPHYFDRYFGYALAREEISDTEISSLLTHAEAPDGALDALIKQLATRNPQMLLWLLGHRRHEISAQQCNGLAPALAACGSLFTIKQPFEEKDELLHDFNNQLVRFIREFSGVANQRQELAAEIVRQIKPLARARDLLQAVKTMDLQIDLEAVATGSSGGPLIGWPFLEEVFLRRVHNLADTNPAALLIDGPDGSDVLFAWREVNRIDLNNWLEQQLGRDPSFAIQLLRCFGPTSISDFVAPSVFKTALHAHFGNKLRDEPSSPDTLLAHRFLSEYGSINSPSEPNSNNASPPNTGQSQPLQII
jgi:hypothetical protein